MIHATKAVHIDVAMSLSTESFIAALERFVARRGRPESIDSDNGTNFRGAANQLEALCTDKNVQNNLAAKKIRWHFIPPRSPPFGDIWEAAIKSTKTNLKRANIESRTPSYVISQHRGVPQFTASSWTERRRLRWAFAHSRTFPHRTSSNFNPAAICTSRYRPPQQVLPNQENSNIVQAFWMKWSREYLHSLQGRSKWKTIAENVAIVIIKEVDKNPGQWKMGRVIAVYPGEDNSIRVVDVRTSTGVLQRPIAKLIILLHHTPS